MGQRTSYTVQDGAAQDGAVWEPTATDVHTLKHGYNLADVERIARIAAGGANSRFLDGRTRYELAWSGIVLRLYTEEEPPNPATLLRAAQDEISEAAKTCKHDLGIDRSKTGDQQGTMMRRYLAYWETVCRVSPSPEAGVIDRTALWQIWPTLTGGQRDALLALSSIGDYAQAAASLGISERAFYDRIGQARHRFLKTWHEHEAPSRPWKQDTRSGRRDGLDRYGRARITVSQLEGIRVRYQAGETHAVLAAEYGVSAATVSKLLRGERRPAPDQETA